MARARTVTVTMLSVVRHCLPHGAWTITACSPLCLLQESCLSFETSSVVGPDSNRSATSNRDDSESPPWSTAPRVHALHNQSAHVYTRLYDHYSDSRWEQMGTHTACSDLMPFRSEGNMQHNTVAWPRGDHLTSRLFFTLRPIVYSSSWSLSYILPKL